VSDLVFSPDPSFPVTSAQAKSASSLANERSSMSECSSSSDISDECSSPGSARFDITVSHLLLLGRIRRPGFSGG
jgi:hypothetical protein